MTIEIKNCETVSEVQNIAIEGIADGREFACVIEARSYTQTDWKEEIIASFEWIGAPPENEKEEQDKIEKHILGLYDEDAL
jgi:hypothetical protein